MPPAAHQQPAAAAPLPWIPELAGFSAGEQRSVSDAAQAALADFEAAAEPAQRRQVMVDTMKKLQCHDSASHDNQVQMVARYAALMTLQHHMRTPTEAEVRARTELPPRPPSAATNAVIRAAHKAAEAKVLKQAVKDATAAKKKANARLLGNPNLETWAAVEKYCLAELAGPGADDGAGGSDSADEEDGDEHAPRRPTAARANNLTRTTLQRHMDACRWYVLVARYAPTHQRPVLPTVAALLYARLKIIENNQIRLHLVKAVKNMREGTITIGAVRRLLKRGEFQPTHAKPPSPATVAFTNTVEKAADVTEAAERAEALARQAQVHLKAAQQRAAGARQHLSADAPDLAAAQAAAELAAESADQATTAEQEAQTAAHEASATGTEAVELAGHFVRAQKRLEAENVAGSVDRANAAATQATRAAAAAQQAAQQARDAVARAVAGGRSAGSAGDQQLGQQQRQQQQQQQHQEEDDEAEEQAAAAQTKTQRRHGDGVSDEDDDSDDADANGVKRLRITPTWWVEQMQPQYVTSTAAMGAAGSSNSSSGSRATYVSSLTRRALCGLLSQCPELWEGSEQALDQVVLVIKAVLSTAGSGAAGAAGAAAAATASAVELEVAADVEVVKGELAICRDALRLFHLGQHAEAAEKLTSSARKVPGAVMMTPECSLRSPFPAAAAAAAAAAAKDATIDDEFEDALEDES